MATEYLAEGTTFTDIADAIRKKEASAEPIVVTEMAERISVLRDMQTGPLIDRSITACTDDTATSVGDYAFYYCLSLQSVSLPLAEEVGFSAFSGCSALKEVNLPNVESTGSSAFASCTGLESISMPKLQAIGTSSFNKCAWLIDADFPSATSIASSAFNTCTRLQTAKFGGKVTSIAAKAFYDCRALQWLDLTGCDAVPTLANTNAFSSLPTTCEIRVPEALAEEWKVAANWSTYASRIVGV